MAPPQNSGMVGPPPPSVTAGTVISHASAVSSGGPATVAVAPSAQNNFEGLLPRQVEVPFIFWETGGGFQFSSLFVGLF